VGVKERVRALDRSRTNVIVVIPELSNAPDVVVSDERITTRVSRAPVRANTNASNTNRVVGLTISSPVRLNESVFVCPASTADRSSLRTHFSSHQHPCIFSFGVSTLWHSFPRWILFRGSLFPAGFRSGGIHFLCWSLFRGRMCVECATFL